MEAQFHELLKVWFLFVEQWGYLGIFLLMAMESSIFPVPSEIVMPPAAYWAAQGKLSFWGVVIAGTTGSYFGSIVTYYTAQWLGLPIVKRYGKYFLLGDKKLEMAEFWVRKYGAGGIFFARLLPVVRHLISIPAGILKMPVGKFSLMTITGSFLWCWILSWFGQKIIGGRSDLLQNPEALMSAIKDKTGYFVQAVVGFMVAYGVMVWMKSKTKATK